MIDYFNEEQFKGYNCAGILIDKLHSLTDKQKSEVLKNIEKSTNNYLYFTADDKDDKLHRLRTNIYNLGNRRIEYFDSYIHTGKTKDFMNLLIINGVMINIEEYVNTELLCVRMSKEDAERLAEYDTFFTTFEIKDLVLAGAVITALQKGAFIKELNKVCGVRLDTQNYDCEFMLRTYDGETTVRVKDFGESWWNW